MFYLTLSKNYKPNTNNTSSSKRYWLSCGTIEIVQGPICRLHSMSLSIGKFFIKLFDEIKSYKVMFKAKTILKAENAYQEELQLQDGVSITWN